MPVTLIFDADVFLILAQHPANHGAIHDVTNRLTGPNPPFELVVPECVATAYHREKADAGNRFWGSLRTAIKNFRQLSVVLSEPERIATLADELNARIDVLQSGLPETIQRVDDLIGLGRVVHHDDKAWADAAKRFREGKPPGHRSQKSSVTDCLLWQVVTDEAKRNRVIFCTNNKADFSDPKHGAMLHPELAAEMGDAKYCYHSLDSFLEKHIPTKPAIVDYSVRCVYCGSWTDPGLIERPSMYGGWSAQRFCSNCGRYTDLGDLPDD